MKPERKLIVVDRVMPLVTVAAGAVIAIGALSLMNLDLDQQVTLNNLIGLVTALAAGHIVATGVDGLLSRVVGPYRDRLLNTIESAGRPDYPIDVAIGLEAYLSDLRAGLPLAVEMAGPQGEMPESGQEWADYRLNPYRLDALTEWHDRHSA
ncbi:hypothetical protein [Streptomyces werraensis]|uniref:hypothetical protein n=1 Tax=Streptomyces werraensis TaxID=68284 RepID=UPI003433716C